MNQPGFIDLLDRYAKLVSLGDPLPKIDVVVGWSRFRPVLANIRRKDSKSQAGRSPFEALLMFKALLPQSIYNLSDDQDEFQIRDRYSFQRFMGLTPEGRVPDAKTIWLFCEELKRHDLIDKLFELFDALDKQIEAADYVPRKGLNIDASIVEAVRQRNRRDENDLIKSGSAPKDWSEPKRCQKMSMRAGRKSMTRIIRATRITSAWTGNGN